ncbi:glycosyltransferase [Pleurocapsa sp. PCC 7319]|uniref:glycosyltransferase family 4 protein n=1 Tax=Pleurocapsa sp. PCC 7319 TaxID=118161 RepID=UPI00034D4197|nr:glycosyltransferase [Pleurocapsa sp. PCC 7319]
MKLDPNQTNAQSKKIKVLFLITALRTGGAEMMLYKLLSKIDRSKFSPTVISMIEGGVFVDRIQALNIPIYFLGMQQGIPNPQALVRLNKLLNKIQPDLIQGWMYHANLIAHLANVLSRSKVPVFWSIHHSVDSLWAEKITVATTIKLTAILSHQIDQVIFSAEKSQRQHLKLGYRSNNAMTISDNFDISKYKPASEPQENLRHSLNLPESSILIGSIARYHPMKDHACLIEAAAKIVDDYPEVHFILVGPNVDDKNTVLTEQIQKLGIVDRIHLLGERQDIPTLMTSLDIFTSSSAYGESFPNVLGEAMSCQIPCVTTDIGDSQTIVGDTGVVIPPKDPEALAEAWRKLIFMGIDERQNLGKKARKRVEIHFDLDGANSFVKKYESIYKSALYL